MVGKVVRRKITRLVIALLLFFIFIIVVYAVIKNYRQLNKLEPQFSHDASLIKFLETKIGACVEYKDENKCDSLQPHTTIQIVNGSYVYGSYWESETKGGFRFAVIKGNDGWGNYYADAGSIPDCSQVQAFPIGIFGEDSFDYCYNGKQMIDRATNKSPR